MKNFRKFQIEKQEIFLGILKKLHFTLALSLDLVVKDALVRFVIVCSDVKWFTGRAFFYLFVYTRIIMLALIPKIGGKGIVFNYYFHSTILNYLLYKS